MYPAHLHRNETATSVTFWAATPHYYCGYIFKFQILLNWTRAIHPMGIVTITLLNMEYVDKHWLVRTAQVNMA